MRLEFCTVKQGGDQIKLLSYKVLTYNHSVFRFAPLNYYVSIFHTFTSRSFENEGSGRLTNLWVPHFETKNPPLPAVPVLLLTTVLPCIFITSEMQLIQCSLLFSALYMFRVVFPPIIRSL